MSDKSIEDTEYLDAIDPNNYVIGVVHIPPGCDAKDLLNTSSHKMLNKYFKKLTKRPEKKLHKILPTSKDSQIFELISEGPASRTQMPFMGKSSKGGHCLRLLNIHRLQILLTNKNVDDPEDGDDEEVEKGETQEVSSRKRSKSKDSSFSSCERHAKRRKTMK